MLFFDAHSDILFYRFVDRLSSGQDLYEVPDEYTIYPSSSSNAKYQNIEERKVSECNITSGNTSGYL